MIILEPLGQLPFYSVCHACHSLTKILVKAFGPTVFGWNTLFNVSLYVRGVTVTCFIVHTVWQARYWINFPDIFLLFYSNSGLQLTAGKTSTIFPNGLCAWMEVIHMNSKVASPLHTARSQVPNESVPHSGRHGSHPNTASRWYVHVRQDLPAIMTLSYGRCYNDWWATPAAQLLREYSKPGGNFTLGQAWILEHWTVNSTLWPKFAEVD